MITPEQAGELARAVEGRAETMLELIRELVSINSHTPNKAGGDAVGEVIAREAMAIGLVSRKIPSEKYADHWVFSTPSGLASPDGAVVFVGHHDTVFPPGTFEGFTREGGIARGPGVLDM
ncbi:MAG: M20 family peptidase, partial [Polyangiaceae bacterium]|nr:M20 family peptidase [Polyangiaceae bacterium]